MTKNLNKILDNSFNFVLKKNIDSASMISLIKSKTVIKQEEEEESKRTFITKLDFKAVQNQMINNQLINDLIIHNGDLEILKENLKEIFNDEHIYQSIETTKHNSYFSKFEFKDNLVVGEIDLNLVTQLLTNNLLSEESKKELLSIQEDDENQQNNDEVENQQDNDEKQEEVSIITEFQFTMKWLIVAGIVIGLFIIIFLIIKKNNNKINNLSKLNTTIKYISNLSDDSITSSIVDLGTEL